MTRINQEYFNALMREPTMEERAWKQCLEDAQAETNRQIAYEQTRAAAIKRRRERDRRLRQQRMIDLTIFAALCTAVGMIVGAMI